ncbi:tyrosine-type recombinase/integrase [Vibrio amylolyticus]|uniref:tyrosine-type recombinase/integrase n=1 Tax=Vibrio amylolyticus TaxID=2847292 RepID=UPI0035541FAF
MASYHIEKIATASKQGKGYRCRIRERRNGVSVIDKSKFFATKKAAETWGKREVSIIEGVGVGGYFPTDETIGDLLKMALTDPTLSTKRTKRSNLKQLLEYPISLIPLKEFNENHLIGHCNYRIEIDEVQAQTVAVDVSNLRSIFKKAKAMWGMAINDHVFKQAHPTLVYMGLVKKSTRRSRRPTQEEIKLIHQALSELEQSPKCCIPYSTIFEFSILTCMRIGEVCSIRWEDVNEIQRAVRVRDRKDPRKKEGNHQWVPLLGDAWDILQRQPRDSELIFPYHSRSITAGFRRTRKELGIEDLRYHDLRREGASRLFEAGFTIEEVAQVTGHRSLNILWQVYTELYPNSLQGKKVKSVLT